MKEEQAAMEAMIPAWVHSMGVATWVTNPTGTIIFLNQRAADLFGQEREDCLNSPCHRLVAGLSPDGKPQCHHYCSVKARLERDEEVEPYTIRIGDPESEDGHWLQLLVIPFERTEEGVFTVHCAFLTDRAHIIESYLDRVATRTPVNIDRSFDLGQAALSRRELEVLEHLAADHNLYEIAEKLNISYYTVRNHVQHILGKMGVHSTLEAVALFLLSSAPDGDG